MSNKQASDGSSNLDQTMTSLKKKKSELECSLYEIQVLTKVCRILDNCHDEEDRSSVIFMHNIMLEKLVKIETLIERL